MTPKELADRMTTALPAPAGPRPEQQYFPFALLSLTLDGTHFHTIIPHIYHRMLQDPENRAKVVESFRHELEILGKHPEDWNGRVTMIPTRKGDQ